MPHRIAFIHLKASNGKFVAAEPAPLEPANHGRLVANRNAASNWETFEVYEAESSWGARLVSGGKIALKARGTDAWMKENPLAPDFSELRATSPSPVAFTVINVDGSGPIAHLRRVALRTPAGKFWGVSPTLSVNATQPSIGPAETFTVEMRRPACSLKASTGQFVSADLGWFAGEVLKANRDTADDWERFELCPLTGWPLASGDTVALKAANGKFVSAENGGGGRLVARGATIGTPERLRVEMVSEADTGQLWHPRVIALRVGNGKLVGTTSRGGDLMADRSAVGPSERFTLFSASPVNWDNPAADISHLF